MNVWVVWYNDYDDPEVLAVKSTEAAALLLHDQLREEGFKNILVDEYVLDEEVQRYSRHFYRYQYPSGKTMETKEGRFGEQEPPKQYVTTDKDGIAEFFHAQANSAAEAREMVERLVEETVGKMACQS